MERTSLWEEWIATRRALYITSIFPRSSSRSHQRTLPSYHEQTIQHKNRKLLEVFFFLRMKDLTVMIFRDSKDTAASDREFLKSLFWFNIKDKVCEYHWLIFTLSPSTRHLLSRTQRTQILVHGSWDLEESSESADLTDFLEYLRKKGTFFPNQCTS